ncbi:MAG TPA: methyltransferase domain-containing protein [Candidatus Saccharimonadales bacterium]
MSSMQIASSISEDDGIATLTDSDLEIYSVGISTGGVAEIRMATMNPKRHIVATTIDVEGVEFAKQHVAENGLDRQIEAKVEDVTKPLAYQDASFDYVYARLVLHYLPEQGLIDALSELHRILKPAGKLFVVVRSTKCPDALRGDNSFDPETNITTFTYTEEATGKKERQQRFFHSEESISKYVHDAGFSIKYVKSYDEHLFVDFMRTIRSPELDNVIELLAVK